jgi:mannose-1-phosphate guanylyltransferase/mannose-1-phosphate guanylyltransferase/mannose-6-phosphate isomerase
MKIVPVILAGGSGTRLWPLSRDALPKQFQPLIGPLSTYQETIRRVSDPMLFADPVVITSDSFRFFARRQAAEVGATATVVLEPERRDSAAAMAAAAVLVERLYPGALMLALAADHVVLDDDLFRDAIRRGVPAAAAGRIVVFGIEPTEPKTSYGYIQPGQQIGDDPDVSTVDRFVEKPDLGTAIGYCRDGYLWNSGNFLVSAAAMIEALHLHAPDVLEPVERAVAAARTDLGFVRLAAHAFAEARKTSIDYAVIEKATGIAVVRGRFRWSDVGAFDALWQVSDKDGAGNALHGNAVALDARGCLIHSDGILTTVLGADDLAVVATADAVLVARKDHAQGVKALVDALKVAGRSEVAMGRRDYRPWGFVEAVVDGDRFAVKRIVVDPGRILSLQRHRHRAEHWVVVSGTASVALADADEVLLAENESLYVPLGAKHRLANRGRIPLVLIEVRTGSYLGEDDIERFDTGGEA